MNETTAAPVVVVTEERKRRKGLVWIAGGAALLLGGSTFALWSATDAFSGGSITAGNLDLAQAANTTFWDVSPDRLDVTDIVPGTDGSQPGHALSPSNASTWRIVPGDRVAASFSAEVTLEGDNLVAALAVSGIADDELANTAMSYTYEIYQSDSLVVAESPLFDPTTGDPVAALMYLSAPTAGQENGQDDATVYPGEVLDGQTAAQAVFPMNATSENFTVVIYGTFDADTIEQDQVTVVDTLNEMALSLTQVRDTGAQFS